MPAPHPAALRRLSLLVVAALAGLLACALLLGALARPAFAAAAQTHDFPGPCGATLQGCINSANPGDTIRVLAGTYTASLTLNKAVSLTGVSSATVVIRALTFQRVLTVTGAAVNSSVVISGLTFSGGQLLSGCPEACRGAGVLVTGTAQPLFVNVTISGNVSFGSGGGLYAHAGSPLVLVNSVVRGNLAGLGGGGAYATGSASLAGGRFENNQCTQAGCLGGGLRAGSLALIETGFINNAANGDGGGAWSFGAAHSTGGLFLLNQCTPDGCHGGGLHAVGTLWLTDTTFMANTAAGRGGGAYTPGEATLSGGQFLTNESALSGGGLYASGQVTMTAGQFTNNTAGSGGGLMAYRAALDGGWFERNTAAAGYGGGANIWSQLTLSGTHFISNQAAYDGGGLMTGHAVLNGGKFQGNQAGDWGGGLASDGTVEMTETVFLSNTAASQGGGALVESAYLSGGLFLGNQSGAHGGGLYVTRKLTLTGTQFINNQSDGPGGGLYTLGNDGYPAHVNQSLFQGNHAANGQGGGLAAGWTTYVAETQFLSNVARHGGGGANLSGQVTDSLFQGNYCYGQGCQGGGLRSYGMVRGVVFVANRADLGGGFANWSFGAVAVNNLFAGNRANHGRGAAVYVSGEVIVTLQHNTIASATLGSGSAVHVMTGTINALNNLISQYSIGYEVENGTLNENYSLFSGVPFQYSGASPGLNSLLNGQAAFVDALGGDFRLSEDSDAIDAGFNAGVSVDAFGNFRPTGLGFDIGFHEFGQGLRVFLPLVMR